MCKITISNSLNDPYIVLPVYANNLIHLCTYHCPLATCPRSPHRHHPVIAMNRNSRYSNHQDVAMCRMHLHNRHVSILAYFFSACLFLIHAFV